MAEIDTARRREVFRRRLRHPQAQPRRSRDNEFVVLLGPSGCGKTTTLRAIAGLEEIDTGDILIDGKPVQTPAGRRPRHRLRVPALRALSASDRLREHRLPAPRHAARAAPTIDKPGARGRQVAAASSTCCAQAAVGAFRRRHAARRHRPRAGAAAEGDADGRADRRARRQAARGDAHRAQAPAPRERLDHDLRHPRPDRGDVARRPHRDHARGRAAAGRHARRGLPAPGQPVRRAVRRQPGHEHRRGQRSQANGGDDDGRARRRRERLRLSARSAGPHARAPARRTPSSCSASGPKACSSRARRPPATCRSRRTSSSRSAPTTSST